MNETRVDLDPRGVFGILRGRGNHEIEKKFARGVQLEYSL